MMKGRLYAHSNSERSEIEDELMDQGWSEELALKFSATQDPLYEVVLEFDYDAVNQEVIPQAIQIDGVTYKLTKV
jgi:hypothetical protein